MTVIKEAERKPEDYAQNKKNIITDSSKPCDSRDLCYMTHG